MTNHPNRRKWTPHPSLPLNDNGNGGIQYRSVSESYPGVTKVKTVYYAKGRGPDNTRYAVGDNWYPTLAEAVAANE